MEATIGSFCPSLCTKMPVPPLPSPPPRRPTPPPAPTPVPCPGLMSAEELRSLLKDEEIYEAYLQTSPRSPSQVPKSPNFTIDSSLLPVIILVIKNILLLLFKKQIVANILCILYVYTYTTQYYRFLGYIVLL